MSDIIKPEPEDMWLGLLVRLTFDPWIFMLSLGGLAHYFNKNYLAIGFWPCLLVVVAIQSVSPQHVTKWKVEDE